MTREGISARPLGRVLRLLLGVFLIVETGWSLIESSPSIVAMMAGVVVAEFLFYAAVHAVILRTGSSINRWVGAVLAVTPVALVFVLSGAAGQLGTNLFIGISLLFTALRNDAGCEVMTLPGMAFGKRTHLVCIAFSPIDWAEETVCQRFGHAA